MKNRKVLLAGIVLVFVIGLLLSTQWNQPAPHAGSGDFEPSHTIPSENTKHVKITKAEAKEKIDEAVADAYHFHDEEEGIDIYTNFIGTNPGYESVLVRRDSNLYGVYWNILRQKHIYGDALSLLYWQDPSKKWLPRKIIFHTDKHTNQFPLEPNMISGQAKDGGHALYLSVPVGSVYLSLLALTTDPNPEISLQGEETMTFPLTESDIQSIKKALSLHEYVITMNRKDIK